jgi:uncharacterized membrane protein
MVDRDIIHNQPLVTPAVRKIDTTAPFRWLAAGWQDFHANPVASGFYGLAFVLAGLVVISATMQNTLLVMTFITGFFLIAPFLCLGLYELSRQREMTGSNRLGPSLFVFMRRRRDMALLVVFQALIMIAWIRLVTLMSAIYVTNTGTSVKVLFDQLFTSSDGLGFVSVFVLAGAALATLVFVTSVIAWPMLLHRATGVLIAISTSVKAVMQNKLAMLVWAGLIVSLIVIGGVASLSIGLVVILPVIGHASWHAYRDLVE